MGACFNALLKRFVDALQGRLGLAKAGDIGKSGDIAAAGHGVAADFYDGAVQHAFGLMPGAAAHMLKPALYGRVRVYLADQSEADVVVREVGNGTAGAQQSGGVGVRLGIVAVPGAYAPAARRTS